VDRFTTERLPGRARGSSSGAALNQSEPAKIMSDRMNHKEAFLKAELAANRYRVKTNKWDRWLLTASANEWLAWPAASGLNRKQAPLTDK
jgi:hypothetical protein